VDFPGEQVNLSAAGEVCMSGKNCENEKGEDNAGDNIGSVFTLGTFWSAAALES
jgi:hypothetical protein